MSCWRLSAQHEHNCGTRACFILFARRSVTGFTLKC